MPFAGLGGSTVPVAVTERAARGSASRPSAPTAAPSTRRSPAAIDDPEDKRLTPTATPLPGVELRLDDDGEIVSRGPDCFLGYTDPELTASVFDDDGWYRTGDVGVLDDDGYLTITDRVSDIIIRGGENISAQEVEELLLGLGRRRRGRGRRRPDERLGEQAAAVLRLRAGAAMPTLDDVRDHLAAAGPGPPEVARVAARWSTSSPAPRRGRSRSSACASSCDARRRVAGKHVLG